MSLFERHRENERGPWESAPRWAREIGEMLAIVIMQNEILMAHQQNRECIFSAEDQKTYHEIFKTVVADVVAKVVVGKNENP